VGNAVVDAIFGKTQDSRVRMAMVMGGMLESGLSTAPVGDSGHSYGPYQIYLVAHPNVTPAQARDPGWATAFMLPAYVAGVSKVPDALWQANPAKASATAAYYAEKPKVMYPDARISKAWPTVQAAMNGQTVGTGGGSGGGAGGGIVDALNPLDAVGQSVDNAVESFRRGAMVLANMALFFAATIVGGLLVAVGLVMLFRETSMNAAGSQVGSAFGTVNPIRLARKVAGNG
jgi:hypothetical protein